MRFFRTTHPHVAARYHTDEYNVPIRGHDASCLYLPLISNFCSECLKSTYVGQASNKNQLKGILVFMRKMNLLFGALALGLGVIVGTLGVSLLTNPSSSGSFISKLRGQENVQTVTGVVNGSPETLPALNTVQDNLSASNAALYSANPDLVLNQEKQQIVADYKQDIGIFFAAWKSADMDTFRLKLAKAYTGELFEKHAQRAQEFLVQGVGLNVTQIIFDQVDVESADANTATLRVDYRYKARDYSLTDKVSFGEEHEQTVQVRVNLLKQNSRWIITGESSIQ